MSRRVFQAAYQKAAVRKVKSEIEVRPIRRRLSHTIEDLKWVDRDLFPLHWLGVNEHHWDNAMHRRPTRRISGPRWSSSWAADTACPRPPSPG